MRSRAVSLPRLCCASMRFVAAAEPRLRAPLLQPLEHVFHGLSPHAPAAGLSTVAEAGTGPRPWTVRAKVRNERLRRQLAA